LERNQEQGIRLSYSIRPCESLDDLAACIRVQKEIWGYPGHELYPLRMFVNLTKIGGHVLGAFTQENQLVGFVASMPAWRAEHRYYHSLSLRVLRTQENMGIGRALKLEQRRVALRAGVDCIEWTFDPLRAKNAYLNIVRLGAIVRRYLPNYYGDVESRLQKGLPSDRLVAEWWLKSVRVRRALSGKPPRAARRKPADRVEIPPDVGALLESAPKEARAMQSVIRDQLRQCFVQGLAITGFEPHPKSPYYVLDTYED
jgi:predicted GNAT superfamily acetyltransferase